MPIVITDEVRATDFERLIKPMTADFADAMCSRFAGREVMPSTVWLFLELTGTNNPQHAT